MDTGEQSPMPLATPATSAFARRVHAEREWLVERRRQIDFGKAPWEKRHRIESRHGQLSDQEL